MSDEYTEEATRVAEYEQLKYDAETARLIEEHGLVVYVMTDGGSQYWYVRTNLWRYPTLGEAVRATVHGDG